MRKKVNCVLILDDDRVHNFIAALAIRKTGLTDHVHTVYNGSDGIKFINEYRKKNGVSPSMIFLDINMPVMDGIEFIEAYNRQDIQKRGKEGAIAIMTLVPKQDKEKLEQWGLKAFIPKPITKESVIEFYKMYHESIDKGSSNNLLV